MERAEAWRWLGEVGFLLAAAAVAVLSVAAIVAPRVRANRRALEAGRALDAQAKRLEAEIRRTVRRREAYRADPFFRKEVRLREMGGR